MDATIEIVRMLVATAGVLAVSIAALRLAEQHNWRGV